MPRGVTIGGHSFLCYPLSETSFKEVAAIYVIVCRESDGSHKPLDVGQSGKLGKRIDNHKYDREDCWHDNCPTDNIQVCVYKMPSEEYTEQDRLDVEKELRKTLAETYYKNEDKDKEKLPCGEK